MTTTEPTVPAGAEADDWYIIDHDGLPTSTGRNVTTPNLSPYGPHGPDIRVQVVQHPDGTYDENTLIVRVDDDEFSGDDARKIARSLTNAAETFEQWSFITRPRVDPIECTKWCAEGDGHPNEFITEDQTCRGDYAVTVLSLPDQSDAAEVASYAKRYNGGQEHVCLNVMVGNIDVDVPLTAAEVRRVAAALLEAADQIDLQGNRLV
jgi:hypothetical protein